MDTNNKLSRIDEIRERWANVPPMDCGTSDTGAKCEAYLYERDFPNTLIATMADLYDMGRLNALAKSKSDIDYLLSQLKDGGAEDAGRLLRSLIPELCDHCHN